MNFEEQFKLEQHKARCVSFVSSNQATIEYSKMALRGAFLLNAGCIIPIVYSKVEFLYPAACMFAIGALCAAVASGASYISQSLITRTWYEDLFKTSFESPYPASYKVAHVAVPRWMMEGFRIVPIVCVLAAYCFFALGLEKAWDFQNQPEKTAIQRQNIQSPQQKIPSPEKESKK